MRFVPIAHHGNTASSPEEAAAVRDLIAQVTGATFVDHRRRRHTISHGDIAVITPYNAQVARLDRVPPPDVGRGTVDRYQGKTAAVVIISLAARSAETAPRGLDFLLDRNRLNVALSRARAAVFVVGSPQLMNAAPTTIRTIEAANDTVRRYRRCRPARLTHVRPCAPFVRPARRACPCGEVAPTSILGARDPPLNTSRSRSPAWHRDEIILALDLYVRAGGGVTRPSRRQLDRTPSLMHRAPVRS